MELFLVFALVFNARPPYLAIMSYIVINGNFNLFIT